MTDISDMGRLELAPQVLDQSFNREPIGFDHNLSTLAMFELDSLRTLAEKYAGRDSDYMVASSASAPDQKFRAVKATDLSPAQAIDRLKTESVRILLKRPQNYDSRFPKTLGWTNRPSCLSVERTKGRPHRAFGIVHLPDIRENFDPVPF